MFIPSGRRRSFGGAAPREVENDSLAKLLLMNTCYEAMPNSGRVVVLDEDLVMCQAFHRIIAHATRHVLLSDAQQGGLITGILSVTDFIRVLLKIFRESKFVSQEEAKELGLLTIRKYQELVKKAGKWQNLVWISAEHSLLEVVRLLSAHRVHRIPVLDPDTFDPVYILTHKRILKFIWCFGQSLFHPSFITQTPKKLGVGTWEDIRFVYPDTPLHECLDILLNLGVSGVPVVEHETHKVLDVYSRFDAIGIALQSEGFNLEVSVKEALQFKHICNSNRNSVLVRDTQSFYSIVSVLVDRSVHRVCVVDENDVLQANDYSAYFGFLTEWNSPILRAFERVMRGDCVVVNMQNLDRPDNFTLARCNKGIISLSDVMKSLVLEPGRHLDSQNPPRRRFSQVSFDMTNTQMYLRTLGYGDPTYW